MLDKIIYIIGMGFIGAVIGWVTNVIAIKLLFRPYEKITIPLIRWRLQGLIPKRQKDIASAIGHVVGCELITGHDVVISLSKEDVKDKLVRKVQELIQKRVREKMPFILPQVLQETVADYVSKALSQEVANILDNPARVLNKDNLEEIKSEICLIVENKILSFEMQKFEDIIQGLARTELKHIELLGGVLGFLIGVLQGIITLKVFM